MFAKFATAENYEKFNPLLLSPHRCDLHENYLEDWNPGPRVYKSSALYLSHRDPYPDAKKY